MTDISMIPRPGPEQVPVLQPMPQRNETSEGDRPARKAELSGPEGAIQNELGSFASSIGMDSQSVIELVTQVKDTLNTMQKESDGGALDRETILEVIWEILDEKKIDGAEFFKSMDLSGKDARAMMLNRSIERFIREEGQGAEEAEKTATLVQSRITEGLERAETPEARREVVHDAIRSTLNEKGLDSEKFLNKLEADREANNPAATYVPGSDRAAGADDSGIRLIDIKT